MKVAKIAVPTKYKSCIITPAPDATGFDVFESNGRWFHVKTQKQAKWWASIHTSLEERFHSNFIKPVPAHEADITPTK